MFDPGSAVPRRAPPCCCRRALLRIPTKCCTSLHLWAHCQTHCCWLLERDRPTAVAKHTATTGEANHFTHARAFQNQNQHVSPPWAMRGRREARIPKEMIDEAPSLPGLSTHFVKQRDVSDASMLCASRAYIRQDKCTLGALHATEFVRRA